MALKLADKLAAFLAGQLHEDRCLPAERLAEFEVRGPARPFGPMMFERGAAQSGQTLSTQGQVFMGAYSYMNEGGFLRDGSFVGRYCSIGRRVTVGAGMHALYGVSTHPALSRGAGPKYNREQLARLAIAPRRDRRFTIVGNDVWIGDGAVIVPGVNVGMGAVIGSNSVVTRDVPPFAVVGGIPAKVIRHRHPPEVAERLLASDYWEMPLERLKAMSTNNVFEFLDECTADAGRSATAFETFRIEGTMPPA
jgi:virginiamycin A acetyltransferase